MENNYQPKSYSEILKATDTGFYNITHNFDSYDIVFTLYDNHQKCVDYSAPTIKVKDSNTITIYWARAIEEGKYRIVIKY